MTPEQKFTLAVTALQTGLVIVLAVLIFLVNLVKGYGAEIQKLQSGGKRTPASGLAPSAGRDSAGIPPEVVAAIAAAVYMTYGESAGAITSIRRSVRPARSAWSAAGLLENTRPF